MKQEKTKHLDPVDDFFRCLLLFLHAQDQVASDEVTYGTALKLINSALDKVGIDPEYDNDDGLQYAIAYLESIKQIAVKMAESGVAMAVPYHPILADIISDICLLFERYPFSDKGAALRKFIANYETYSGLVKAD